MFWGGGDVVGGVAGLSCCVRGGDVVWVGIAVSELGCGGFGGCCVGCGGPPVMVSSFLCCVDAVGERRRSDLRAVFDGGMVVY